MKRRFVVDTNRFVPAIWGESIGRFAAVSKLLDSLIQACLSMVVTAPLMKEYENVAVKHGLSFGPMLVNKINELRAMRKLVEPKRIVDLNAEQKECVHEKDWMVLQAAISADADFVFAKDGGMRDKSDLIAEKCSGLRILGSRECWKLLGELGPCTGTSEPE